ncbi:lytic transglycosylase domain-containing protein [Janthinobacterium violaceinigrum]|uniref:Transglycosylase SLT domain-containing protein n=1 Tax=Janthinobacterium violaceinigrum TaxID=2654252 RepID=A0A6I1IDB6_9BURK|nr:lytic transglycosylase domain-containing protein [Janthinobacterium violaceinigrum]KAB8065248.1 transglycosylase SLT domain-containing protein [Janthinobacterium violaceinigrum]
MRARPLFRPFLRYHRRVVLAALLLAGAFSSMPAQACWREIGAKYGISPYLLHAIAKTESNLNPRIVSRPNANGSYDIGLMQINSSWLPIIARYGITEAQLLEPCVSIEVGAWILAQNIHRLGNSWTAVGAYNSPNAATGLRYAARVYRNLVPEAAR